MFPSLTTPCYLHKLEAADEAGFYRVLKLYAENMAEHRQNVFRVGLDLVDCTRANDGKLHWGYNAWTDAPIKAPGQHRGDGWHVYPKRAGLIDSLRWEQMRNGLQDYECLWLLENQIATIKATLSERIAAFIEPSRRGIGIASLVIATYHDYTQDPAVLYRARRQTIEETLDLAQSPRILLQTTPLEHSAVARNCAIDVHGWAEPGTSLTINGQKVVVASDGLFLRQLSPSRDEKIAVEARHNNLKKTVVRQFKMFP